MRMIPVAEASQVGEVRRAAQKFSLHAGLDATAQGRVAIIVNELASNLVKHAKGGRMLLQASPEPGALGVRVISIDSGPGIADATAWMRDGFSTSGTMGHGLGSVRRIASQFALYSTLGGGTVVFADVLSQRSLQEVQCGAICLPMSPLEPCGDEFAISRSESQLSVVIADGLGHGAGAAESAQRAISAYAEQPFAPPVKTLELMHQRLSGVRGAAIAVGVLDLTTRQLRYAGIGNIAGALSGPGQKSRGLFSHDGTAGVQVRTVQEFTYDWPPDETLTMYSDGMQSRWSLAKYPGLATQHPAILSGVLFRDFSRSRDDTTVLVIKTS